MPPELSAAVSTRFKAFRSGKPLDETAEHLGGVIALLRSAFDNAEYLQADESLEQFVTAILMQEDPVVASVCEGCRLAHIVTLFAFMKEKHRKLCCKLTRCEWREAGAHLTDISFAFTPGDAAILKLDNLQRILSLSVDDEAVAGCPLGSRLVRINDTYVTKKAHAEQIFSEECQKRNNMPIELGVISWMQPGGDGGSVLHIDPASPL